MSEYLKTTALNVSYGQRHIVRDVDLQVDSGDFIGLLGPNGAGKTTLLRALLGLLPSRGSITLNTTVGYVPQRHDVNWDFPITAYDAVLNGRTGVTGWFRRPKAACHEATREALALVQLESLAQVPISALSGGQRQRVLIARALVTQPQMLLLDEPFTGLDAPNTDALLGLFSELCAAGHAIIMSTHNLAEAIHVCPRLVLFNGSIIADGPAQTVRTDTQAWVDTFKVSAQSPLLQAVGVQIHA